MRSMRLHGDVARRRNRRRRLQTRQVDAGFDRRRLPENEAVDAAGIAKPDRIVADPADADADACAAAAVAVAIIAAAAGAAAAFAVTVAAGDANAARRPTIITGNDEDGR